MFARHPSLRLSVFLGFCLTAAGGGRGAESAPAALCAEDFEASAVGGRPAGVHDDSGWAGSQVPLAVVDSGDPRHRRVLECQVSGYCQIVLARLGGLAPDRLYRLQADVCAKGGQDVKILLRRAATPYTVFMESKEKVGENWRRIEFYGRYDGEPAAQVWLMLIMNGMTTLQIDNVRLEEVEKLPGEPLAARPGNLLPNSGFELGLDGWFVRAGPVVSEALPDPAEGARAARLPAGCTLSSSWLRLSYECDYLVRAKVRAAEAGQLQMALSNYQFPDGGYGGQAQNFPLAAGSAWQEVAFRWRPTLGKGKLDRFAHYYLNLRPTAAVQLDALEVKALIGPDAAEAAYVPAAPVELAVTVAAPQNVLTQGEAAEIGLLATGGIAQARLRILDEREAEWRALPVPLTAGAGRISLPDLPCGYWRLVAEAPETAAAEQLPGEALLPVVPPMPEVPLSEWTYGGHAPDDRDEPQIRRAVWKLGLRWDRTHDTCKATKWYVVQPQPDGWDFHDEILDANRATGQAIMGSLAGLPGWVPLEPEGQKQLRAGKSEAGAIRYAGANRGMNSATYPLWREYARRMAEHWRGRIDTWEITNEPNLSGMSAREYLGLLIPAYEGVKLGNPQAVVVGLGGATPISSSWVGEAIALGAWRYSDAISIHGYGCTTWSTVAGPGALIEHVTRLRRMLTAAGAPAAFPVWDSECGVEVRTWSKKFDIPHGDDALGAARMFPKSVAAVRAAGIKRVFYYTAHPTTQAGDGGLRCLCDFNGAMKITVVPLAVAISLLEGTGYEGQGQAGADQGVVELNFAGPRGRVRMLWTLNQEQDWELGAGPVRVVNMWGREVPPAPKVRLSPEPIYVLDPK